MKKLIISAFTVLLFTVTLNSTAQANTWDWLTGSEPKDAQEEPENKGLLKCVTSAGKTALVGGQVEQKPLESRWNATLDAFPYVLSTGYPSTMQLATGAYALGIEYNVNEFISVSSKYFQMEVEGVELDGEKKRYRSEHALVGLGLRWNPDMESQVGVTIGTGGTEVTETNSGKPIENLGMPIWIEAKYLFQEDNFAFGPMISIVKAPSESTTSSEYIEGGHVVFAFTVKIGLSEKGIL